VLFAPVVRRTRVSEDCSVDAMPISARPLGWSLDSRYGRMALWFHPAMRPAEHRRLTEE
jgi:hypothetical protein